MRCSSLVDTLGMGPGCLLEAEGACGGGYDNGMVGVHRHRIGV